MNESNKLLCEVDFLPASYREEGLKRRAKLWQLLVIAGFGGVLLATELGHRELQQRFERDLTTVDSRYVAAAAQSKHLAALEGQLADFRARAELLTYLRHAWPTSQLLDAIVEPVPDSVTLAGLEISHEMPTHAQNVNTAANANAGLAATKDSSADRLPAASRDLKQIRSEHDGGQTVITLTGTMTDPVALHAYLQSLGHNRLFTKASLSSIASPAVEGGAARFSARVFVRPGYGEPGGPAPGTAPGAAPTSPNGNPPPASASSSDARRNST